MARIPVTGGFTLCPEGIHVFRIYDVSYDEEFGKLEVRMVNAQGIKHTERFSLINNDGEANEGAMNAFAYFAKTALNDFSVEDIDHTDLVNCYIKAEVVHTKLPSKKDPTKTLTFANLGDKWVADGFEVEPVPTALTMSAETEKPKEKPKAATPPAATPSGIDLAALLK